MAQAQEPKVLRQSDVKLFKLVIGMVRDKLKWMESNFQGSKRKRKRRKKKTARAAKKTPTKGA
jgi:hypothetical protein